MLELSADFSMNTFEEYLIKELSSQLRKVFGDEFIRNSNMNYQKLKELIGRYSLLNILEIIQNDLDDQNLIDIGLKPDQIEYARAFMRNIDSETAKGWEPQLSMGEISAIFRTEVRLKQLIEIDPYKHGYVDYRIDDKSATNYFYPEWFRTVKWDNVDEEMNRVLTRTYKSDLRLFPRPSTNLFYATIDSASLFSYIFPWAIRNTIGNYLLQNYHFFHEIPAGTGRAVFGLGMIGTRKLLVPAELKVDTVEHLRSLEPYREVEPHQITHPIEQSRRNQLQSYMRDQSVKYGVLSSLKRTFIFEKFLDEIKPNGKRVYKFRMSRQFNEREALKAIFFVCIKAIEDYKENAGHNAAGKSNDDEDTAYLEDSEEENDQNPQEEAKLIIQLQTSQYHNDQDMMFSEKEHDSFFSTRQSLYKIVLDYEETDSFDPYSSGRSGLVFLGYATHKYNQSERVRCAAKITEIPKFGKDIALELCQEARILNYLNQLGVTCVPKLLYAGVLDSNAYFTVVTEFLEHSRHFNLAKLKSRRAGLLAAAINELHSVGVHHGDLESRNVLFQTMPGQPERCVIIDFAFSTLFTKPRQFKVLNANSFKQKPNPLRHEFKNEKYLFNVKKKERQLLENLFSDFQQVFKRSQTSNQ